jgi:hypothetical protein
MSDAKQTNWLPWVLVAALAYFAFVRQPAGPVEPKPEPVLTISQVLDKCYEADRLSKIAVLRGIDATEFASDRAKLEWINGESETRRIADFQPYTNRVAESIDAGKTYELAEQLEKRK